MPERIGDMGGGIATAGESVAEEMVGHGREADHAGLAAGLPRRGALTASLCGNGLERTDSRMCLAIKRKALISGQKLNRRGKLYIQVM